MIGKRPLREEMDELRSMVAAQATVLCSLIGALGPETGATMRRIIAELPEQEAFQALSTREQRIFAREFEKFYAAIDARSDMH